MRRRVAFACVVVAASAVAACTTPTRPTGDVAPVPSVAPSIPSVGPVAPTIGPHHYSPGAASAGDPLDPGAGNGGYDVAHYALSIGYSPGTHSLTGDDLITAFATQDLSRFNLDFHGLRITSLQVNGAPASFQRSGDELVVTPGRGIDVGARFTTHVTYGGVPTGYQDGELGREGFLPSGSGAIVQGQPNSAASWFPVNDHPRDKATYEINVTAPAELQALSNGVLAGKTRNPDTTVTWHWVENQPMASYLATAMIGRYRVTTRTDQGRPAIMAVDSSLPASYDSVLNRTPEVVDFLQAQFGPYPFDSEGGVIHADSRVTFALENQSRPVYSQMFFATSGGPANKDATGVLAHELAHQWYGDSVSLEHWSDIWLNEGFATYAQWLWTEHEGGATPKQTFDVLYQGKNGQVLPQDPPGAPTEQSLFDQSVYVRGAATLEALRISVGDAAFFRIIRGWAATKAYGNGSTSDFISFAKQVSGKALDEVFHSWLFARGKPAYPKLLS